MTPLRSDRVIVAAAVVHDIAAPQSLRGNSVTPRQEWRDAGGVEFSWR